MVLRIPLEFQKLESYDYMEEVLRSKSHLWSLPHCHLPPTHFPKNFKGKILYIQRDIRAVAVSAYNMFSNLPFLKPYMEKHGFHDRDAFACNLFEGKNLYGCPASFDKAWMKFFAQNPSIDVLFLKFEGMFCP